MQTNENAADLLTTSLGGQLFRKRCHALGWKLYLFLTARQVGVLRPTRLYEHAVRGTVVTVCA
jgi:hypothetical protein